MMNRVFISALISTIIWSAAPAQEQVSGERDRSEGRRFREGGGEGSAGKEGRRGRRRGRGFGGMFDRIARELELDETQMQQFDEIKAAHRERMEPFRERREAIRQAREEGNDDLADQLRSELRAEMRDGGGPRALMRQALDELEPILNEEQLGRLNEMRERQRERGERFRRRRRMMEQLPEQLQLDDGQREQFSALMDANRKQMRERFSAMRPLLEEMREARESNDTARVEELQAQLDDLRPDPDAMEASLFEQVEGILREDQKQQFGEFRQTSRTGRGKFEMPGDIRMALRAAMRLELSREQKTELKKINSEARKAWREARKNDRKNRSRAREAEGALTAQVKAQILGILDQDQVEKYQQQLEKMDRKSGKGSRSRNRNRSQGI